MQRTAKNSAVRSAKKSAKRGLTNPRGAYIIANIKGKGVLESHSLTPFLFAPREAASERKFRTQPRVSVFQKRSGST